MLLVFYFSKLITNLKAGFLLPPFFVCLKKLINSNYSNARFAIRKTRYLWKASPFLRLHFGCSIAVPLVWLSLCIEPETVS